MAVSGLSVIVDTPIQDGVEVREFVTLRTCTIGAGARIYERVSLKRCSVGAGAEINAGTYAEQVHIGAEVQIGPNCSLVGVWHPIGIHGAANEDILREIVLETGCLLGAGVIVLPGVTIGKRAVIGAGTMVAKDVPAETMVYGPPSAQTRMTLAEYVGRAMRKDNVK
ncbi:MAG: acyltransferase [Candidatus Pacebacteria bacterium]|nr:acyltransferase [Candidatus Paceibacterota bacterium]